MRCLRLLCANKRVRVIYFACTDGGCVARAQPGRAALHRVGEYHHEVRRGMITKEGTLLTRRAPKPVQARSADKAAEPKWPMRCSARVDERRAHSEQCRNDGHDAPTRATAHRLYTCCRGPRGRKEWTRERVVPASPCVRGR